MTDLEPGISLSRTALVDAVKMNPTRLILDALRLRHDEQRNGLSRAWIYAEEVRVSTGLDFTRLPSQNQIDDAIRLGAEQSIDAFAFHTWPSKRYKRVAYEVKASRSDLKRELNQPYKCAAALALSNEFYLVAPTDVLEGFTLPDEWGTIEWATTAQQRLLGRDEYEPINGKLRITRSAPWRDTALPPYSFMLSLARNLQAETSVA